MRLLQKIVVATMFAAAPALVTPALAKGGHGHGGGHGGGAHIGGGHIGGGAAHIGGGHIGGGVRSFGGGGGFSGHVGGRHRGHGGRGIFFAAPYVYGSTYPYYDYDDYNYVYTDRCAWLKRRALETGRRVWWRRYRDCRDG